MPDAARAISAPQRAMAKLGLVRDIDLALHLPLRYEDETRITRHRRCARRRHGAGGGHGRECRVESAPRRQLVVRLADDSGELVLRFLHFYPSHQKTLAVGARVRVRGEVRGGFLGREMVHPVVKPWPARALPTALTPVYPTSAQLPQAYLRKAVVSALARAPLDEMLPPDAAARRPADAARRLAVAAPPAARRTAGHAGRPQPPGLAAAEVRGAAGAAAVAGAGAARARAAACAGAAPRRAAACTTPAGRAALRAHRRAAARVRRDRRRPGARRSRCTGCCRATWARARRWWRRWPRRWPSTPAGNAR